MGMEYILYNSNNIRIILIPINESLYLYLSFYQHVKFSYNEMLIRNTVSIVQYITKDTYNKIFCSGGITEEKYVELKSLIQSGRLYTKRSGFEFFAEGTITHIDRKHFIQLLDRINKSF